MTDPFFFGFGSLVNTATHDYVQTRPARLDGWQRIWVETEARDIAFLSAEPRSGCAIHGLMAAVPDSNWAALDAREFVYRRVDVSATLHHDGPPAPEVALYSVPQHRHITRPRPAPILLSYLDVVVQGYAQVFGAEGVADFFATTVGWDRAILDDRAAPQYPRHQKLTTHEQGLVDQFLTTIRGGKR